MFASPGSPQDSHSPATDSPLSKKPSYHSVVGVWIVGLALVSGITLRTTAIASKRIITHDEAISYLAATGHQGEYARIIAEKAPPYGTWVTADEWKRLIRPEDPLCLGRIGDDLANFDRHPPLYFWLLHLWSLVFGVHLWTGPSLNTVLACLSVLALFGLALRTFRDRVAAATVAALWSVSPAVLPSSAVARQYDLLALCAILFVWQTLRVMDHERPVGRKKYAFLALITAAGLLTHYHFPLLVLGCAFLVIVRCFRQDLRRAIRAIASMGLGCVLFIILHPGFYLVLRKVQPSVNRFSGEEAWNRLSAVLHRYTSFFLDSHLVGPTMSKYVEYFTCGLIVVALLVLIRTYLRDYFRERQRGRSIDWTGAYMVYFFLWTAGTNILLYITCLSPRHAMEPKYPSMVWPLYAFVPVLILQSCRVRRAAVYLILCVLLLVSGATHVAIDRRIDGRRVDPAALFDHASAVVVDKVSRGVFPRFFWHFRDQTPVFAASPKYLVSHGDEWLAQMEPGSIYISNRSRKRVLGLLSERYHTRVFRGAVWGFELVCLVERER